MRHRELADPLDVPFGKGLSFRKYGSNRVLEINEEEDTFPVLEDCGRLEERSIACMAWTLQS
jgi:hypothetical protein